VAFFRAGTVRGRGEALEGFLFLRDKLLNDTGGFADDGHGTQTIGVMCEAFHQEPRLYRPTTQAARGTRRAGAIVITSPA